MANSDPAIVAENGLGRYQQSVEIGRHRLIADEPLDVGGADAGPNPYDLLKAALGACTSMTLRMYAERKALPLARVSVAVAHAKQDGQDVFTRAITLEGDLDPSTRQRLLEIANRCPVHKTLSGNARIDSSLVEPA
jgi:putative redox protein